MRLLLDLLMRRALGWLGRGSSIRALELENTVLRHEVRLLRRQRRRLDLRRLDRAVLAAASRAIPRDRWSLFLVRPQFYFVLGDEDPDFIRPGAGGGLSPRVRPRRAGLPRPLPDRGPEVSPRPGTTLRGRRRGAP